MTCGHVWPDELTPDAACLLGCGLEYGDWSEEVATTEIEVPA